MLADPQYKHKAIPLLLHGDGVQFTMKGNSLLTVQFMPLLAKGWAWETIWLCATWPKNCRTYSWVHGPHGDTWKVIWSYLVQAFEALLVGRHPNLDPNGFPWPKGSQSEALAGKPLCDGKYTGVIWGLPMDKDYAVNDNFK